METSIANINFNFCRQVQTEVNKIFNKTAEKNNYWKNELNIIKEKCYETNELFDTAVENLTELLSKEPNILIQGTSYQSLLEKENEIFIYLYIRK